MTDISIPHTLTGFSRPLGSDHHASVLARLAAFESDEDEAPPVPPVPKHDKVERARARYERTSHRAALALAKAEVARLQWVALNPAKSSELFDSLTDY